MWIVKSWRELPEDRHSRRIDIGVSYKDYCVDGVFATVEAANAEARRARDRMVDKYDFQKKTCTRDRRKKKGQMKMKRKKRKVR